MARLNPAWGIINRLGGSSEVARATGVKFRVTVCKWWTPRPHGTGGTIPARHHVALLNFARAKEVPLTAADFLPCDNQQAAE
jgi:hypothetical protein